MKPVKVQLIGNATEEFQKLNSIVGEEKNKGIENSEHQQLLRSITQKIELIKANPQYGDSIPKALIKKTGYDVDNMWAMKLTGFWRMLYTLRGSRVEVLCFILEIFDHEKYDKLYVLKLPKIVLIENRNLYILFCIKTIYERCG